MISANTKVYGIVGNPISHSLSPLLQNALAEEMNIDMKYVAFPVTANIKDAINGAFFLGIQGFNVTIPFKKDMLEIVSEIDERAKNIGASIETSCKMPSHRLKIIVQTSNLPTKAKMYLFSKI